MIFQIVFVEMLTIWFYMFVLQNFSVKDGVFRAYTGPRDKNDFISYVEDKKWALYTPIPNYKHPASPQ